MLRAALHLFAARFVDPMTTLKSSKRKWVEVSMLDITCTNIDHIGIKDKKHTIRDHDDHNTAAMSQYASICYNYNTI